MIAANVDLVTLDCGHDIWLQGAQIATDPPQAWCRSCSSWEPCSDLIYDFGAGDALANVLVEAAA